MAMRYKARVINNPSGLAVMLNATTNSERVGTLSNGDEITVDTSKATIDGATWFHIESSNNWVLYQHKGVINLKLTKDMSSEASPTDKPSGGGITSSSGSGSSSSGMNTDGGTTTGGLLKPTYTEPSLDTGNTKEKEKEESKNNKSDGTSYVPGSSDKPTASHSASPSLAEVDRYYDNLQDGIRHGYTIPTIYRPYDVLQQNEGSYPSVVTKDNRGEIVYDYEINTNFLRNSIQKIKENLNIPSAYTREQLNVLMNQSFNRYDIVYPDYLLSGLSGVVFFTRPDIWVTDEQGKYLDQVENDPQLYYISRTNSMVLKELTLGYSGKHEFIPLLCNTCKSLDVGDETVETVDIGETFSGYKLQYARHSIRSLVSGTFNCKFQESYDLAVTHMMQGWCSYESSVYLGTLLPKTEYIGAKILDYACDAYLFIIDRTNTIKFYSKYYGVFPINVNKSVYSFDEGSPIHFPEQNITFAYFHREDLHPRIIVDFNKHSKLPYNYKLDYEPELGHGGTTWSGPPFIEVRQVPNGTPEKSDQLILRYRPK